MTREMVLQMLLKMSLSHFIDEQEGNREANASIGFNLSTLFCVALSILEMAPKRAFTLR